MGHPQPINDGKVYCHHFSARVSSAQAAQKFDTSSAECFGCGGKGRGDPLHRCQSAQVRTEPAANRRRVMLQSR